MSIFNTLSLVAVCKFLHAGKYALAINLFDTFLLPVTLPTLARKPGAIFRSNQKLGRRGGRAALPSGEAVVLRDSGSTERAGGLSPRLLPRAPGRAQAAATAAEGGDGPGSSGGSGALGMRHRALGTARLSWECAAGPGDPPPQSTALLPGAG